MPPGTLRRDPQYAGETGPGPGPDFICIGQQKAGTRWLYDQLAVRPDVWMPPIKEINFLTQRAHKPGNVRQLLDFQAELDAGRVGAFDPRDVGFMRRFINYPDHVDDIDWYGRLFTPKGPLPAGDVSTSYGKVDSADAARIAAAFPSVKIVFLAREPVSRLWSSLCMHERNGDVTAEEICSWKTLEPVIMGDAYRRQSFATRIWANWAAHIPPEQMRFWLLDDIAADPDRVVDEICRFIGIAPGPGPIPAGFNRKEGNRKLDMPPEIRARLVAYFAAEHERAAALFGGAAVGWRDRYRPGTGSPRPMA